ncbi:NAD(P)-dependent oxidoreductase [Paeniglutamicibacter sulfureus]|uniref:Adenosylhomocysteinase n=1 Tax=Paeniglutamicibacter sulfureus TaxID=43666 RepID=A0ABU2BI42_9MICC|nr:NAD(P)-dependent oxidoreductase [Paeniglutamicibacter sulfureus]MDR7357926.1 adenosylhomocysteinase [Paeniglutamicibacter sulfureus]
MAEVIDFEEQRLRAYFSHLAMEVGSAPGTQLVCVAHMVANSVVFLPALADVAPVGLLLPKPKTMNTQEAARIAGFGFRTHELSRKWASSSSEVVEELERSIASPSNIVLVDIGGYFAESLNDIAEGLSGRLIGVMEGTENGVQKYEQSGLRYSVPIVTVARSPLKLPEDYHVGSGIVFSVEAVLREQAQILQTRTACVIGYGRVGSSVAEVLRGRGIPTVVHDRSPIAMAEAAARGFQVFRRLDDALRAASLVISATGNHALDSRALANVRSGSVIATVTSADDEFAEGAIDAYIGSIVSVSMKRYDIKKHGGDRDRSRYFWLINDGNPANFLHGAVIGPAMQLIEGEKMAAIKALVDGTYVRGEIVSEVSYEARVQVAEVWNEHFLAD